MKFNVGIGILLFCGGATFAFLFMQGNHNQTDGIQTKVSDEAIENPVAFPDSVPKNAGVKDKAARRQATRRHDKRDESSGTIESPGNGHDSDARRITNVKSNSNTSHKGMVSHSHSSSRSELLITRNRHTTSTAYVPVPRERIVEKTTQSHQVINRLMVVEPEGASPVDSATTMTIADPVNPQSGMLFKGYNLDLEDTANLPSRFTDDIPALTAMVVKTNQFSLDDRFRQGVWEGFLKCKRSAKCTILVERNNGGCVLFVNGKCVARLNNGGGNSVDYVDMKVGFNHIKLFASYPGTISVSLKPAESTKDPKPFSPKDLFYDKTPEMADVFNGH